MYMCFCCCVWGVFFLATLGGMWDPSSQVRDGTCAPLWLKHGFLTPGLPGKSLSVCVLIFHPIFSGLLGVFGGVFCCYCFKLK